MQIDELTFAAAQSGNPAALERLLIQVHPDVRRYARQQCYASSSLEDVVQEAMIIVYRRVGTVRNPAALATWLVRIVARLCMLPVLMTMKGVAELKTIEDSKRFAYTPVDDLRLDLVRALESLSHTHREVILLRDLQEMTIGEIAKTLGLTREATKSRLHRARTLVREFLSPTSEGK